MAGAPYASDVPPSQEPTRLPGEPTVVAAPHCELGCAATALARHGIDMVRDLIGAEWSLAVSTRRLTTVPQPFLDRTDVAFSAQGRGWREAATEIAGLAVEDHVVGRADYLGGVRSALAAGGVLSLVNDSAVPWLSHASWSHGLLPHAIAIWSMDSSIGTVRVIEGHAWWQGIYSMTEAELLAAAFPDEDVHGIAGRFLSYGVASQLSSEERRRRSVQRLAASAQDTVAGHLTGAATAHGTFATATGRSAIELATQAYRGLRYVCRLAERPDPSPDMTRDLAFGRYTFQRWAEELAFVAFARAATVRLLREELGGGEAIWQPVAELAAAWRALWRSAESLAAAPAIERLDDALRRWQQVADADVAVAVRVADFAGRSPVAG